MWEFDGELNFQEIFAVVRILQFCPDSILLMVVEVLYFPTTSNILEKNRAQWGT